MIGNNNNVEWLKQVPVESLSKIMTPGEHTGKIEKYELS